MKFALGSPVYDQFTVVIVINIRGQTLGMVVDSVSDVTNLSQDQIRPAPEMGSSIDADFLIGLAPLEDRMLILMDIERFMTSTDMGLNLSSLNTH
jgi:purine-binding chemotaxis protein CheW